MAYKINVHGVIVEADTLKEALALAKEISPEPAKPAVRATVPAPVVQPVVQKQQADLSSQFRPSPAQLGEAAITVAFLSAIASAGDSGVESKDLMSVVGADQPRGFGSKVRPIKRVLSTLGFSEPQDAFRWERVHNGRESVWLPGPKLPEALLRAKEATGQK